MTFLVAAALAVFALVALPVAAHLLRRGRAETIEFPAVRLVPLTAPVARQRSRLEDRLLFALRAAMIGLLALLGATPFVRCSRLSLARTSGSSVAVAIVIDDSMSMKTVVPGGETRWSLALRGAREIVASARSGDSMALVLAGTPARLGLGATTDLSAVERVLDELSPSDRGTDLADAVRMARSTLVGLPHGDRRVIVLSDLAGDDLPAGEPPVWAPLDALREDAGNCGVAAAEARGMRAIVSVVCNGAAAARGRTVLGDVKAVREDGSAAATEGSSLRVEEPLASRDGVQTVTLEFTAPVGDGEVKLSGGDALADDDVASVERNPGGKTMAVIVDPARSSVKTGGPTVLEQALTALQRLTPVRPLPTLPDTAVALAEHSAVILDDPPGLAADARSALVEWLERGGVALALLGPTSASAPLGSTLEPFAGGGAQWDTNVVPGLDAETLTWLGGAAASLSELAPKGRLRFGASLPGTVVAGAWSDAAPFLMHRAVGRGSAWSAGLPASVDLSDFALRPGFLALLEHFQGEAERRVGARSSLAGQTWMFPGATSLAVVGPAGPLAVSDARADCSTDDDPCRQQAGRRVVPVVRGRYDVLVDGDRRTRVVSIAPDEVLARPRAPSQGTASAAGGTERTAVDVSREVAMALLVLFVAELALRAARQRRARGERRRRGRGEDGTAAPGPRGVGAGEPT